MKNPSPAPAPEASSEERRRALKGDLAKLYTLVEELRVAYEQYFMGITTIPPDRQHNEVKRLRRALLEAPFKNSELNFRLRALDARYQTYLTYWERVLREREAGTYSRDRFKADVREQLAAQAEFEGSEAGAANRGLHSLFESYQNALEKSTGRSQKLNFDNFQRQLLKRAEEVRGKTGAKRLSFTVTVKDGKVTVQAKPA